MKKFFVACICATILFCVEAEKVFAERTTPIVQAAQNIRPSVVAIKNKKVTKDLFNRQIEMEGIGSGIIFRSDGYIVTCTNAVENATELSAILSDGKKFSAELVGKDETTGIAVIKIDAENLPVAKFGNSDEIMIGESVVAIGNSGVNLQGSLSTGIVSGLNRTLDNDKAGLIQMNLALNPGDSGSALVNYDSEVIGMNSWKLTTQGTEGITFAIPINQVKAIAEELIAKGYISRPHLGITMFDKQIALSYGYQLNIDSGVYVFQIQENGSADKAGLKRGDIILSLDDKEVNLVEEVRAVVATKKVGDKVKIRYLRDDKENIFEVILEEAPHQ